MKKLFSLFSILLLCVMGFGLTACGNEAAEQVLKPTDIGYEVTVYPAFPIYYKVNQTCTIYLTEISMTLKRVDELSENETLTSPFYPYAYSFNAIGSTDSTNSGGDYQLNLVTPSINIHARTIADEQGAIIWNEDIVSNRPIISLQFSNIYCYDHAYD